MSDILPLLGKIIELLDFIILMSAIDFLGLRLSGPHYSAGSVLKQQVRRCVIELLFLFLFILSRSLRSSQFSSMPRRRNSKKSRARKSLLTRNRASLIQSTSANNSQQQSTTVNLHQSRADPAPSPASSNSNLFLTRFQLQPASDPRAACAPPGAYSYQPPVTEPAPEKCVGIEFLVVDDEA